MRIRLLPLALVLAGLSGGALTCDVLGLSGIVEENNLYIAVDDKNAAGITEKQFTTVLDRVEEIYAPIITGQGKELAIVRNWDDGTVNAYAQQIGNTWQVQMFGGLARHETITEDAFALVACHELGHHLGGLPKKVSWWSTSWASNEGQADYWGNLKCMHKYMEKDNNVQVVAGMQIDPFATKTCQSQYQDAEDIAICQRSSMAGLSLGNLFRALRNQTAVLKFETPDRTVVATTNHNHPDSQCRLDTYFAGAICSVDPYTDVSNTDVNEGVCAASNQDKVGLRPLCWYKPAAE